MKEYLQPESANSKHKTSTENASTSVKAFINLYQVLNKYNLKKLSDIYHQDITFIDPLHQTNGINEFKTYFQNMYHQISSIKFNISNVIEQEDHACLFWVMTFETEKLNRHKPINVDGMSLLKYQYPLNASNDIEAETQSKITATDNKIIFHRDYYDVGQMLYENIPVMGNAVNFIKKRMSSK